jgi:hypothetical protein
MSPLGTLKHADERQERLSLEVDRKGPADDRSDAVDPGCVKTPVFTRPSPGRTKSEWRAVSAGTEGGRFERKNEKEKVSS